MRDWAEMGLGVMVMTCIWGTQCLFNMVTIVSMMENT